jgi:hypothetical protein
MLCFRDCRAEFSANLDSNVQFYKNRICSSLPIWKLTHYRLVGSDSFWGVREAVDF